MNKNLDRRRNLRKVPEKFAFIQLERDDGGTVLNVSEGGLSFNTFAPVQQNGLVHFWFSLNLNERIEAWGEVAWTNGTKEVGGLRFVRLSERAARQIHEWVSEPISREVPEERLALKAVACGPSNMAANEPDAVARFVSKARSKRSPTLPRNEDSESSNTLLPQVEATGELVPLQRYRSAKRRQFSRGLVLGMCISAAVLVPAIKYWDYRHEKKGPETVSSDAATPKGETQTLPPVTTSTPNRPPADVSPVSRSKTGTPSDGIQTYQTAASARQPQSRASDLAIPSQPAKTTEGPRLGGTAIQRKASMTPQQLWAAVQNGSTKAAVTLAELYIKGEGVQQNCDQARVLLLVASEKRNAEAIKRLHDLDKTGCP